MCLCVCLGLCLWLRLWFCLLSCLWLWLWLWLWCPWLCLSICVRLCLWLCLSFCLGWCPLVLLCVSSISFISEWIAQDRSPGGWLRLHCPAIPGFHSILTRIGRALSRGGWLVLQYEDPRPKRSPRKGKIARETWERTSSVLLAVRGLLAPPLPPCSMLAELLRAALCDAGQHWAGGQGGFGEGGANIEPRGRCGFAAEREDFGPKASTDTPQCRPKFVWRGPYAFWGASPHTGGQASRPWTELFRFESKWSEIQELQGTPSRTRAPKGARGRQEAPEKLRRQEAGGRRQEAGGRRQEDQDTHSAGARAVLRRRSPCSLKAVLPL